MHQPRFLAESVVAVIAFTCFAAASVRGEDRQAVARAKELELIALLRSDAPAADKAVACKRLAVYGSAASVPELARLLSDPQLASWSRIALEVIPGTAADEALHNSLGSLEGNLLIGAINSIGVRRSELAVAPLKDHLKNQNAEVAKAAAVALGHIGNPQAIESLRAALASAPPAVRGSVAEGCVLSAERLLKNGRGDEAAKVYDDVRKADVPRQNVLEATRGAILSYKPEAGIKLLIEQLQSSDKVMYQMALGTAREFPGRDVAVAIVAEMNRAAPERAAMLPQVLADRNETAQLPAVLSAAEKGARPVQLAAIGALERLGDVSCLPTLLALALKEDEQLSQSAKKALADLPGKNVDGEIVAGLSKAETDKYKLLIELIGQRRINAVSQLLEALEQRDASVRSAALTSLGATVGPKELKLLIAQVVSPKNAEDAPVAQQALKTASIRMPDREACATELAAAYDSTGTETKVVLLQILGAVGGTKSLETIGAAAKTNDQQLQDASSRLLGEWLNSDPAPLLLELSKSARGDKYQVRAIRGYIRIAKQFAANDSVRAEMCRHALAAANHAAEKKLVLDVLRSKPHPETLSVAIAALKNPELKEEATPVVLAIIQSLGKKGANVKELLTNAGIDPVKVEIVKAEYGTGANVKDVTEALRKQVGDLPLISLNSPSYNASFGGDPAPNSVKQLKVQYKINGKAGEATFAEDAAILLPLPK
jgi:HEAT repeat protein